jgi:glutamine synthetase
MSKTLDLIKEHEARWIDLRFTDFKGKEQHVTFPSHVVNDSFFDRWLERH